MKVPYLQVRSNCLVYYELPTTLPPRGSINISKPSYSGTVTKGSVKRIKKAIDILIQKSKVRYVYNPITNKSQPFKLNFITLTVSSKKNIGIDEGYKNLLKPYLRKLRGYGPISYMWKAEFQKRGQLHYHLTSNVFIPHTTIRNDWNNLQRKHRYLDDYAQAKGHFNANSTDVHSVYKINDLAAYLSKYMAKPVYNTALSTGKNKPVLVKGKVWDCSTDLKKNRYSFVPTNKQEIELRRLVDVGQAKLVELDHCVIFKMQNPLGILTNAQAYDYLKWKS